MTDRNNQEFIANVITRIKAELAAELAAERNPLRRDYYTLWLKARALTEAAHLVGKVPAYPEMADLRAEYIARAEECLAELMEAVNDA